jgi:hypothetical protein
MVALQCSRQGRDMLSNQHWNTEALSVYDLNSFIVGAMPNVDAARAWRCFARHSLAERPVTVGETTSVL